MVNLPLLDISRKYGSRGSDMIDISGFVWGEVDFRALLPLECPWTISSVTQRAESSTIQDIAVEVPLDDLQRHSKGRKPHNSRYCRRSAPGRSSAALKGQNVPQFKILPLKCPWTVSSGTQAAQDRQLPVCVRQTKAPTLPLSAAGIALY